MPAVSGPDLAAEPTLAVIGEGVLNFARAGDVDVAGDRLLDKRRPPPRTPPPPEQGDRGAGRRSRRRRRRLRYRPGLAHRSREPAADRGPVRRGDEPAQGDGPAGHGGSLGSGRSSQAQVIPGSFQERDSLIDRQVSFRRPAGRRRQAQHGHRFLADTPSKAATLASAPVNRTSNEPRTDQEVVGKLRGQLGNEPEGTRHGEGDLDRADANAAQRTAGGHHVVGRGNAHHGDDAVRLSRSRTGAAGPVAGPPNAERGTDLSI
jgi:hypothetical protein